MNKGKNALNQTKNSFINNDHADNELKFKSGLIGSIEEYKKMS